MKAKKRAYREGPITLHLSRPQVTTMLESLQERHRAWRLTRQFYTAKDIEAADEIRRHALEIYGLIVEESNSTEARAIEAMLAEICNTVGAALLHRENKL